MRLLILAACLCLQACYTGYSHTTRPTTYPKSNTAPAKPRTHLRCDETGCKVYDSTGQRRYDIERHLR